MKAAIKYLIVAVCSAFGFYYANMFFMYNSIESDFAPIEPIATVHEISTGEGLHFNTVLFLHYVNTPERARAKERDFGGFEIDLSVENGQVIASHDSGQADRLVSWESILEVMVAPASKLYWFDAKDNMTEAQVASVLATADKFGIAHNQLFFETRKPETIAALQAYKLNLIYPIFGFDDDGGSATKREEMSQAIVDAIEQYQPYAIVANAKRYPWVQAYFPNVKKALYYSNIIRPSFYKLFMVKRLMQEQSVDMILIDEYDRLPF
jgi:hypothetical protein